MDNIINLIPYFMIFNVNNMIKRRHIIVIILSIISIISIVALIIGIVKEIQWCTTGAIISIIATAILSMICMFRDQDKPLIITKMTTTATKTETAIKTATTKSICEAV